MGLYASPAYIEKHGRPRGPDDLKSHAILHYGVPSSHSAWALRGGREPMSVPYRLCSNNGDALRVAATADLGITLIPAFLVRDEVQTGRLVAVLDGFEPKPIHLMPFIRRPDFSQPRCGCSSIFWLSASRACP